MSRKIRCAIFGVGRLGYVHAENLATRISGAELVTVVASRMENAKQVAQQLGAKKWTIYPEDVFQDESIDAVVIATPTKLHTNLIIEAAKSKKHIFVDKPITETVEEAKLVIKEIHKNNVLCQVGFNRRFDPSYAEAKRKIEQGAIGTPIYYKGVSRDPGSPPEEYIKTSGGIFLDLCIHEYDIARYLLNDEVSSVKAFGSVLVHPFMNNLGDVDQSITLMNFQNGASCDVEGSRNSTFGYDIRGEVIGTEGSIQIGSIQHHDIMIRTNKGSTYNNVPNFPVKFENSFYLELKHFIECVEKQVSPLVTEIDGRIGLEIAEAATKSYQNKEAVLLS